MVAWLLNKLLRGTTNENIRNYCIYRLSAVHAGYRYLLLREKTETAEKRPTSSADVRWGPWVAALSAGASDMSAWVLMGLPTSIYALGLGQVWIPVGLAIGYTISWLLEAPRLRKFLDCSKRLNHHSAVSDQQIPCPNHLHCR